MSKLVIAGILFIISGLINFFSGAGWLTWVIPFVIGVGFIIWGALEKKK